jgi:hypothetical protein
LSLVLGVRARAFERVLVWVRNRLRKEDSGEEHLADPQALLRVGP